MERGIVSAQITAMEREHLQRFKQGNEQANQQEEHGELVPIAFFRREACRSTLSGCVSPRFRPIGLGSGAIWLDD